jgi:EAL domain-containing protein (putative c-di-GMP-specific phosphodiesterase class I)
MVIIAEGVETQKEANTLKELGVALYDGSLLGQRFLFDKPQAF